ncbi:MAG: amidohydrolase family protein [Planctomycetota bacterium]
MRYLCFFVALLFAGFSEAVADEISSRKVDSFYVIRAGTVYEAGSAPISQGIVVVRNGLIEASGKDIPLPENATLFTCRNGGFLTPGLIDAASTAGVVSSDSWAEHTSEAIPNLHNLDAVDLHSPAFKKLALQGITSVYLTPDPASVIGSQGAVVKTGGPEELRIVKNGVDVKATLGPETWRRGQRNHEPYGVSAVDYRTRRPVTRMGMAWVFRKAFYAAVAYREMILDKTSPPHETDPDMEVLVQVLEGKIPLRIKACLDIDIWSSIRLCREFGLRFVLEEGTEAYRCIPELKAYDVPVIVGPLTMDPARLREGRGGELRPCLNTAGLIYHAGIPLALTAAGLTGENALPFQACYAMRNGLPFEAALSATTSVPARILGVGDRVAALKPGFDADLVLWTARPFSVEARPALVMIHGCIVYIDDEWITDE